MKDVKDGSYIRGNLWFCYNNPPDTREYATRIEPELIAMAPWRFIFAAIVKKLDKQTFNLRVKLLRFIGGLL